MNEIDRATPDDYAETDALMRADLERYSSNLVRIKDKAGKLVPFKWNESQRHLDKVIERQLEVDGYVRVIVLKARQLGISTYIAVRFYRKTTLWPGQATHILTHLDDATMQLFSMAKRIHQNMVDDYRPHDSANSANSLAFGGIDSGYSVGTAFSTSGKGRSKTYQNFHGSEVAFWRNAGEHFGAAMQAVPSAKGTEILLESTANGIGGVFHKQYLLAEKGKSDFIAVFLPWFWADEYSREVPDDFEPGMEELEYAELYGLTPEQVCWMHFKNIELEGDPGIISWRFRQEYPANSAEAFQTSGTESLIKPELVVRARNQTLPAQTHAARVLGVDIARGGDDDTRFLDRRGGEAGKLINFTMDTEDSMEICGKLCRYLEFYPEIQMAFVDVTDGGGGVVARANELGFGSRVTGVNFGAGANEEERYLNKRAEMWGLMRDWFKDPAGADIPDDDTLHRHICGPGKKFDSRNRLQIEAKEDIKKRLKFSPDGGDALALTFAEPVSLPYSPGESWRDDMEAEAAADNDFWTK